jgi:SlyX protein
MQDNQRSVLLSSPSPPGPILTPNRGSVHPIPGFFSPVLRSPDDTRRLPVDPARIAPSCPPSPAMPADLESRVAELETRLAFQDDLLATLDRTVALQDRSLGQLRGELARLRDGLETVRVALGHDVADEPPPPHY